MGSQSVTNFSSLKMKRIRDLVKDYSPSSPKATEQVAAIATAAVGTLGTSPSSKVSIPQARKKATGGVGGAGTSTAVGLPLKNEFFQALSSRSVETAIGEVFSLVNNLKAARDPRKVFEKYGVSPDTRQPLIKIIAALTEDLSDRLSATQAETDSAFAAKDAISKTLIDVLSRAFPQKEAIEIDQAGFVEAFKRVRRDDVATIFMENVANALISLVLDATRGSLPPAHVDEVKKRIRERFVPEFIAQIKKGK